MTTWREPATPRARGPVLFLDRDGVLIEDRHYLADPDQVALIPGVPAALAAARAAGFALVGVSNQSGLGRGRFSEEDLARVMTRFDALLAAGGVPLDAFHFCPHAPDDGCACRKPLPGLLDEAARTTPWDPDTAWLVGDKESDIRLARAVGMGAVLVRTGYGAEDEAAVLRRWAGERRMLVADDLAAGVALILASMGVEP
jgi:D-glycero-D-manno-heptose 1,7-bisphosphate phosphatase